MFPFETFQGIHYLLTHLHEHQRVTQNNHQSLRTRDGHIEPVGVSEEPNGRV